VRIGFVGHLQWTNDLSVGLEEMDQEHMHLIELMDELHFWALNPKAELEKLKTSFQTLIQATQKHFAHEENILESRAYPDLKRHKQVHHELLTRLDQEYRQLESGNRWAPESCLNFFQFWLKTHIKGVDQKYGHFFKKKP